MKNSLKQRKVVADSNHEFRSKLSPEQQLRQLDARLGEGVGAKKERIRLKKQSEK